jgi:uncharacterized NAD(P)/FAD-binding protein YdhS
MGSAFHRIAIVGGGPSGVGVFYELVQFLCSRNKCVGVGITLIEKGQEFGSGLPYRTKLDGHVTNMAVATMSLRSEQVDHFYHWLLANPEKWQDEYNIPSLSGDDAVPRRLFGTYVNQLYNDAREIADDRGIAVETITGEATEIFDTKSGVRLHISNREREFDQVFVCVGNTSPAIGQELKGLRGYFHDAWPEDIIMEGIPNDEPVAILGSGLTAIDAMITLQENGHRAPITMISRLGLLPKVRNKAKPYELRFLSPRNLQKETRNGKAPLSLNEAITLLTKELNNAELHFGPDASFYKPKDESHIEVLKQDISRVKNGHANYFAVLKAIDKDAGLIWNALSLDARAQFDQFFSTLWNTHCYPMPMRNGQRVLRALETGELAVRGGFREIAHEKSTGEFHIKIRQGPAETIHRTRYLINATGQGLDIANSASSILQSGVENGVLIPHPLGGIDVDFVTCRAKSELNGYSNKVYAVGLLTRGVHFYTNSIVENMRCAKRAAADAVENIAPKTPLTVPIAITLSELARAASAPQPASAEVA